MKQCFKKTRQIYLTGLHRLIKRLLTGSIFVLTAES